MALLCRCSNDHQMALLLMITRWHYCISVEHVETTDEQHFNDFFTYNAASLVNKLPACSGQFGQSHVVDFYRNKHVTEDMFSLGNVTVGQVSKILHSMSSSKATGLDEIPAKYLKDGSSVISKLLTHIINLSITTGSSVLARIWIFPKKGVI